MTTATEPLTAEQEAALDVARALAEAGVPVFVAYADDSKESGFAIPRGWQHTKADPRYVDAWRPGGALCAVMGQGLDLVDVDPRNEGDAAAVEPLLPEVIGRASTPSDGTHAFVVSMDVRSHDDTLKGIDVKAGNAEGEGRGFAFIAPTVRASKVTGELVAYEWTQPPDVTRIRAGYPGADSPLAKLVRTLHGATKTRSTSGSGEPGRIQEGARNSTLASLAGTMRRRGMSQASIEAALLAENETACDPPLDEDEVRRIAASVARYEPAPEEERIGPADILEGGTSPHREARTARRFERTEAGQAELLRALHRDTLRYDHKRDRWLGHTPDEHRWKTDLDGAAFRLALDGARQRKRLAADIPDAEESQAEFKFALSCESRARMAAVLEILKQLRPIADLGEGWDADPYLLGVPNGVVDLRTGALRPGRPEDRITMHAGVAYDPDATAPRWEQFLREALEDDERIAYIQRFVGYALTGDTSEHAIVVNTGAGGNGKSVFLDTMQGALGDYAINLRFSSLTERREAETLNADLARLPGKRLATSSETNGGTRLDTAVIKALTGDKTYTANPKYKAPFEFQPAAKFMLAVNELPEVRDASDAMWQRVHVVRWGVTFRNTERDDKLLPVKLAAELPGILAWAVRGAVEWYRLAQAGDAPGGLRPPPGVLLEALRWREASDPLADFLASRCYIHPDAEVKAGSLYTVYLAWCVASAQRERLTMRRFGDAVAARFERVEKHSYRLYRGVGLLSDLDHDPPIQRRLSEGHAPIEPTEPPPVGVDEASASEGFGGSSDSNRRVEAFSGNFPSSLEPRVEFPADPPNPPNPPIACLTPGCTYPPTADGWCIAHGPEVPS